MKNNDPHSLSNLPAYSEDGSVHGVVEAPKGSLVKLKYEIKLGAFTVAHSLPLGLSYPFDWGFVPSTHGPDGDPLDILILHEASTYPGVVLPCRPLGVVCVPHNHIHGGSAIMALAVPVSLPVAINVNDEAQILQVRDTTTERTVILWNSKL